MSEADRSRLLQKHHDEIVALEKDVKKKKGAYKKAAQAKVEAAKQRHEQELAKFDSESGTKEESSDSSDDDSGPKRAKRWPNRNWSSASRNELVSYCRERGLSSKGKKEDMIVRLTTFTQEQDLAFENGDLIEIKSDDEEDSEADDNENSDDDDDDDDDDESDTDSTGWTEEEKERRAKLYKRRLVVIGAVYRLLKNNVMTEIKVDELSAALEKAKVKNFRPELVGYDDNLTFVEKQGKKYLVVVDGIIRLKRKK